MKPKKIRVAVETIPAKQQTIKVQISESTLVVRAIGYRKPDVSLLKPF